VWFDVLASVTQMRVPRFINIFRKLFGPRTSAYIESSQSASLSMLPVMGCENHIVLAIAEISALLRWKELQLKEGCLSIPVLVDKGMEIESKYLSQSNALFGPDPYLTPPANNAYSALEARDIYQRRRLTNDIFRASAKVYLHTVLSGDHPSSPEISAAVTETIECLRQVPQANNALLSRSVVRSVVFGICICGCLTDQPEQQAFLRQLLEQQEVELVGNVLAVRRLMEDVWARRAAGDRSSSVDWREVMCEGGRDLLLLV
jgi:C6 transcription factor Pro1